LDFELVAVKVEDGVVKVEDGSSRVGGKPNTIHEALVQAIMNDDVEMAKSLIDEGADVNLIGRNGSTPLFLAIHKNNIDMVKLLIKKNKN